MSIFIVVFSVVWLWVVFWKDIYRHFNVPSRRHDFELGHYKYWFDEGIAYSELASSKKKIKFMDVNGVLVVDLGSNNKWVDMFDLNERKLSHPIQVAYKQHLQKIFEEVVLDQRQIDKKP